MKKQSLGIPILASVLTIFLAVSGVLLSGLPTRAQPTTITGNEWADGACSNRTLQGDYGFAIEGQFLAGPRAGQQLRGVAMTHFDGEGNLRQVDHVVVNGVPPAIEWSPGNGPYTVNPDCTGTAQINFTDGRPPVNLHLVVVRQGGEIHTVVDANAATSIGIKRD